MPWFYARAGSTERLGPVSSEQMRGLLTGGEVGPADLVWREGMAEWTAVEALPKLAALLPRAQPTPMVAPAGGSPLNNGSHAAAPAYAPHAASFANHVSVATPDPRMVAAPIAAPASLGYYAPRGDMPARAQANLAKYATPTGPNGDWPISDEQIAQLAYAAKLRRRINAGANLARSFFALSVIGLAMVVVGLIVAIATAPRRGLPSEAYLIFGGYFVLTAVATALYWFAGQAIRYCHVWGSLVLATLWSLLAALGLVGALITIVGVASSASSARAGEAIPMIIASVLVFAVLGAICWIWWRAFLTTKPYLNTPVWCQEAIAVSEKSR